MQKCTSKSVRTSTANKGNVLSTAKAKMVMFFAAFLTLVGCEKEYIAKPASDVKSLKDTIQVLTEHYYSSVRTLTVVPKTTDALAKSDVDYQHTAVMQYGDEVGSRYDLKTNPSAYTFVRQSKERIEIGSEAELPVTLVNKKVISDTPFYDGSYVGRDVVESYLYSDGNVDEIHYGYRSLALIYESDTLSTPHIEFNELKLDSISVAKDGEQTALDKPHRLTTHYSLSFTTKGVSDRQTTSSVSMAPYRMKVITDVEQQLTGEPTYEEKWIGCPITEYQLTQNAPTNKGVVTTTVTFPVALDIKAPELREQPSLDSLFAEKSIGNLKCEVLGDSTKNTDGFTSLTYTGSWTSKNTGKENSTSIESTASFTYSVPVKFENRWGSYEIKAPELSFEEGGFQKESVSEDDDVHIWNTKNTVLPKFGTCELDAIDELVRITVAKEKPVYVLPVDSTYEKSGISDEYIITKTIIWSDGSKTNSKFQYDGRHQATATNFGELITSNLSWTANALKANGSTKQNEKKEFTPTTRFEVVYTTTNMTSDASNGVESGVFGFSETHPVVTFVDGDTKVSFEERKVVLSAKGAQPAAEYNIVVRDGVSYKGYTYNQACGVIFAGEAEADVTSQGLLLIVADEIGDARYTHEQSWNGNVTTVKVIKTTPHSFGDDEVETHTREFTVAMTELSNGKVYAENFNFSAEVTNEEKSDEAKDGFWSVKTTTRNFNYVVSNGAVKREMTNTVTDGEIVFNDGTYTFTFPAKFNVTASESFGDVRSEGDYKVTPHIETVTASIVGGPQLTTKGVTDIYVEQDKVGDTSYKTEESWNGNTFTAKVTKTTKHSKAQDEVETFTKSITVGMTNLSDGRVDAENFNFSATVTNKEKTNEAKDGHWTTKSTVRDFTYVVANDAVKRQMSNTVTDGELVFTDGEYTHTFKARLSVSHKENLGNTTTSGDYKVTPHTVTVTAVAVGGPTLTTKGVTTIYVEQDKAGEPTYKAEGNWNGNTYTAKVTETIPHTKAEPEVNIFTQQVTVSMSDLSNGRVDAENTNFSVTATNTEKTSDAKDGPWTVKNRNRTYTYVDSNGTVKRQMSNTVADATITFTKGSYTHTFSPQLTVSHKESLGDSRTEGDYKVTPHTVAVTATAQGGPTLTTKGITSIYVEQDKAKEPTYKAEGNWSGNTYTAKVTKTIPHTKADDEVKTFTKSVTVSMTELSDGRVDAANTDFNVTMTNTENVNDVKDDQWTVKNRERNFNYVVSNGTVKRQMSNKVTDAEIVFADGEYTHTFNAQLTVNEKSQKGSTATQGDYEVTPLTTTVTASAQGGPTLTVKGVTNIYVEVKKEITYKVVRNLKEVTDEEAFYEIIVSRLVNGKIEKDFTGFAQVSYGTYKPNVTRQTVSEFKIKRHEDTIDELPNESSTTTVGKYNEFKVHITAKEYHFRTFFDAPMDADGNTEREVSGHINVWSPNVVFTDPDNGHVEKIDFDAKAVSVKSSVENETYIRQINITISGGEIINRQQGVVALKLPQ